MRILVVEDEGILRSQLVRALREENFAVDGAEDGEEGLYKVTNWPYETVILDVVLPKLDGFEVLRRMRELEITIPVMLLTARDGVSDRVRGLDLGADDYLVKGFDLKEFKARVRALLRRRRRIADNILQARDVTLNLGTGMVDRAGERVDLTGREFAIVAELMSNPGAVIARNQLYERVVDETDDSMSNLLDVHVCNIRKKLGRDFIRTIRGRGYLVEAKDGDWEAL